MSWETEYTPSEGKENKGIFAIHGNLDGEIEQEFIEREQFIGITIGNEEFLFPISPVKEIKMLSPITYVPNCPKYVDGVMNLRGTILPTINLRKMMGHPKGTATMSSRVIIIQHHDFVGGLLVDGITYVVSLAPSEIESQSLSGKELISRIAKNNGRILGIVDLSKIIAVAAEGRSLTQEEEDHASGE